MFTFVYSRSVSPSVQSNFRVSCLAPHKCEENVSLTYLQYVYMDASGKPPHERVQTFKLFRNLDVSIVTFFIAIFRSRAVISAME